MDIAANANEIRHSISSLKRRRRFRIVSFSLLTALLLFVFVSMFFFLTLGQDKTDLPPIPKPIPTEIPTDIATGTPSASPTSFPKLGSPDVPTVLATPTESAVPPSSMPKDAAEPPAPSTGGGLLSPEAILIFSGIGSLLSALATASNVILAWRKDRREVEEFRRKLAELELAQARSGGAGG